ncbi:MAG: hypothetical protein ACYC5A_07515 [Thermoleophilia bacterium]
MNELQDEYGDRIEFIKYNVKDDVDANCEFYRRQLQSTPSMLFITVDGTVVDTTDKRLEKEDLQARLDSLLSQ